MNKKNTGNRVRTKVEEPWNGDGRDVITLQDLIDWHGQGFEFVIERGHIVSVIQHV